MTELFAWWREGTPEGRRAIAAAGLGWMLDAFDVTLFALVLPAIRQELGLSTAAGGALGSVALLAAAAGGVGFGWIADRFGRTRALMLSVILYSVFTAACGLATTFTQFVVFRICLGLGMGSWASGRRWYRRRGPRSIAAKPRADAMGGDWLSLAAAVNYLVQPACAGAVFFRRYSPGFLTSGPAQRARAGNLAAHNGGSTRPTLRRPSRGDLAH